MSALATIPDFDHRDDETLAASEWARLLDIETRAFNLEEVAITRSARNAGGQVVRVYAFRDLPERWKTKLIEARRAQGVSLCRDLLDIAERAGAWEPPKKWMELPAATKSKALKVRVIMLAYYGWLDQCLPKSEANARARAEWLKAFDEACDEKTIRRWEQRLEARGAKYIPVERLRLEAFCDGKCIPHEAARREFPADFGKWFRAQFLDPRKGVPTMGAIYATCLAKWHGGEEIPGLGTQLATALVDDRPAPFPYTQRQLRSLMPQRAARERAGRGKFMAKTGGYTAAPHLDWTDVEPCRRVMFDDKTLDLQVLTDDGTRSFRPVVYIAYCAGTRRVLAFIVREVGRVTQLDVEGLMAAVLRDHGFGGPEAGWPTVWIVERGTVAISDSRKEFIEALFAGHIEIQRTSMIGGKNLPGDFAQNGSGNFFGKGVIESFMASVDIYGKQLPGASGNRYARQPSALGDTTLTLEKLVNSARAGHNSPRSILEEGISTSAIARLLNWMETGEAVTAREAASRQGISLPTLFYSDFVALLGELFRAHNHRRGHRMQGFAPIRISHPDPEHAARGKVLYVSESPADKAARMFDAMAVAGRRLVRPHDIDIAALLHKVKRVTVTANGVATEGLRYWNPDSPACLAATGVQGAARTCLALYNPIQPDALYLLANPPSHLAAGATEIPEGFVPKLAEVLPIYRGPSAVDSDGLSRRAEQVARFNSRASREVIVASAPILLERTEQREELRDRLEPLRATIRSAAPFVSPETLPPSGLARQLAEGECSLTTEAETRAEQQAATLPSFAARLAARQREKDKSSTD